MLVSERLTSIPLETTVSTMVSTSMPGFKERRSNAVPPATAEATSDGSAESVTVRAAALTACQRRSEEEEP